MPQSSTRFHKQHWRQSLYRVIFEADTAAGKTFDVLLLWVIIISLFATMLQSSRSVNQEIGGFLTAVEWTFTGLFLCEYMLRIATARRPLRYIFSFLGLIDLLASIPSFLGLIFDFRQYFVIIRVIRLMRIFTIFKLSRYLREAKNLMAALRENRQKILVFLGAVIILVVIMGTLMYSIEGEQNGFTSIPRSIYWAVVTLTTVGYGDIAPKTVPGQTLASLIMLMGYSIIAVPTGLVTAGFIRNMQPGSGAGGQSSCPGCKHPEHDADANYCKKCGTALVE